MAATAALILLGGAYVYWSHVSGLVRVGELRIDPRAPVDPGRVYTLVLWERELPLPGEDGAHRRAIEEAIDEFRRVWPNIEVELTLLDWDEGDDALYEALLDGAPPDVYGMPAGARLFDTAWQVPVDAYMSDEARMDTLESALKAVSSGDATWSWPRWVMPKVWVAREGLTEHAGQSRSAWSSEQFVEALAEAKTKTGSAGIALNPFDGNLLLEVMVASTGRNPLDESGRRAWSVEEMEAALQLFAALVDRGLTGADAARMSRTRLASFWNRQAAAVAPVNAWLLRHLLARGGVPGDPEGGRGTGQASVPVPPPSVSGAQHHPAVVGGYAVFRRQPHAGDDHTRAAMLLAEHLSRRLGPWEAARLFAAPAFVTSWHVWQEDSGLPGTELDLLVAWSERAVAPPLDDALAARQQHIVDKVLGPSLVKLWSKAPPRQVAEELAQAIDGVRAEVRHP